MSRKFRIDNLLDELDAFIEKTQQGRRQLIILVVFTCFLGLILMAARGRHPPLLNNLPFFKTNEVALER